MALVNVLQRRFLIFLRVLALLHARVEYAAQPHHSPSTDTLEEP